jgi:hypothetical protein
MTDYTKISIRPDDFHLIPSNSAPVAAPESPAFINGLEKAYQLPAAKEDPVLNAFSKGAAFMFSTVATAVKWALWGGRMRRRVTVGAGAVLGIAAVAHFSFGAYEMNKGPLTGEAFFKASNEIQAAKDHGVGNIIVKSDKGEDMYCTVGPKGGECVYKLKKETDAFQGNKFAPASGLVVTASGVPATARNYTP